VRQLSFFFAGDHFCLKPYPLALACFGVGIISGIYGIGGGAIIAPFLVAQLKLPVYTVPGATLLATFVTSLAGVVGYQLMAAYYPTLSVSPDWVLGLLFGVGGVFGTWFGGSCQKFLSPHWIKLILCFCVLFVAFRYLSELWPA
jgi:uncharacterized membrane protein YfcA